MDISRIESVNNFEVLVSELKDIDDYKYENLEYKELMESIENNDDKQILKNHVNDCLNAIAIKYYIRGLRVGTALNKTLNEPIDIDPDDSDE